MKLFRKIDFFLNDGFPYLTFIYLPAYFNSSALLLTRQWVTGGATLALEVSIVDLTSFTVLFSVGVFNKGQNGQIVGGSIIFG